MKKISFYKKVDKSLLLYGVTFGVSGSPYVGLFEGGRKLKPKEYRNVTIIWGNKRYPARIGATSKRVHKGKVYPIAYRLLYSSRDLVKEINKAFISSYIKMESGKKLTKDNSEEVLEITPLSEKEIKFKPFVRAKTDYDKLFQKFIESDVFGWLNLKQKECIFLKSHNKWIPKKELKEHKLAKYVIYYLLDEKNKKLYIGSAIDLFSRLKTRRPEIPEWNKFRYEALRPDFSKFLHRIEYHTIQAFGSLLKNKVKVSSLSFSKYELVNKKLDKP